QNSFNAGSPKHEFSSQKYHGQILPSFSDVDADVKTYDHVFANLEHCAPPPRDIQISSDLHSGIRNIPVKRT
ncbi:hypothetical protein NQ317_019807, partial [Molorchus minor]